METRRPLLVQAGMKVSPDYYYACTACGRDHMKLWGDHCSLSCKQERDNNVSAYRRVYAAHDAIQLEKARIRNTRGRENRKAALYAAND